jgi:TolB-like protein/Flp pilus assembly protein TadD
MEDLSGDLEEAYFADGMTEVLISYLSQIRALEVTSRTSAMHYRDTSKRLPEIAAELGVQAVVESSVSRSGNHIRITVRLIEAASDRALLNATFEEDLDDVLSLQSKIAHTIVERVQVALTPEEDRRLAAVPQVSQPAYEAYLWGLAFRSKHTVPALHTAVEYFEEALAMEPGFARAHAAEADAYLRLASWQGPSAELWPKAMEAANKALAIDEDVPEAQLVLAGWLLCHQLDQQAAERAFQHALELYPGDSTTHLRHAYSLMTQGRFEESLVEARESLESDPVSLEKNTVLGAILYYAGRYDEALHQLQTTLDLAPDYAGARQVLGRTYLQKGMQDEAVLALERALALSAGQAVRGDLGYAYAVSGRRQDAVDQLEKLEELSRDGRDSAFSIALVHHGLGDTDKALDWLRKAYEERDFRMIRLLVDPTWDDLRDDPRFQQMLLAIGLRRPHRS